MMEKKDVESARTDDSCEKYPMYYKCNVCGNLIEIISFSGNDIICCGRPMEHLIPQTDEKEFAEKHVPVCEMKKDKVCITIGSVEHPMTKEHHIDWVAIKTSCGYQRKHISQKSEPKVSFMLKQGEEVKAVYVYCNIHGLWACYEP